jgi:DNA-binding beta-propeller fold protein YncE
LEVERTSSHVRRAAPIRAIQGDNTWLDHPIGILLDPVTGGLYVANTSNNTVTAYAPGANGNATPSATIQGEPTVAPVRTIADVPSASKSWITAYAVGSTGNVAPINEINGKRAGLGAPFGITVG